jgi:hypothetical protein
LTAGVQLRLEERGEEARIGLGNIKKQVEWRFAARHVSPYPC